MRSWLLFASPFSLLLLLCIALSPNPDPQAGLKKSVPVLEQEVRPYFAKNCASCHNSEAKAGGLDLKSLRGADSVTRSRESWESVLRKIKTGEMPPKGSPRPLDAENKSTIQRIENAFDRLDRSAAPNPGAVTAHRLNRAEYNNTVRDLLGVDFHPADDFPQDDSGYGFDNIGDVLSLSSSQMEKYVATSEKIARTALFGADALQPTIARHEVSGRKLGDMNAAPATYDATGLLLPNSLHATHRFPVDGEYLFRLGLNGVRPLGSEALHLGLLIDGKQVQTFDFDPTGSAAFNPDRQDFSSRTVECRLRVSAGDHWIAAVILRMYEGLPPQYGGLNPSKIVIKTQEFKPPPGFPPEKIAFFKKFQEARRKEKVPTNDVRVSALDIGGPYLQSKGASEDSLRKIFTCGHLHGKHNSDCTRKIVSSLLRRAFRRPPTAQEATRFSSLVSLAQKQGDSYEEGISLAVQGMLVSPHFLFRIERDPSLAKTNESHLINQYELASRLSYFLWSSMPDEELRSCADKATLRNPAVLTAQVKRMLKDSKSHQLAENFAGQWLQFRSLESVKPDRERFPDFDEYLRMSMRQETEMFFDSIVREDRSVLDLLFGKYTYLNGRMASFYGMPNIEGPAFRKVDLTGTPRGGVLTQASVLTVTSYATRTSPVLRGKWILENILNSATPPPPPGTPNLDVASVGTSVSLRRQLEEHRKNPTCASCHARMDPLGFGLENFNGVGAWRANDGKLPIDASGSLPDGRAFTGPDGLRTILKADQNAFASCLSTKLLTYALGRGLERYDNATVKEISNKTASGGYRFSNLVMEIVSSRPFQMRKGDQSR